MQEKQEQGSIQILHYALMLCVMPKLLAQLVKCLPTYEEAEDSLFNRRFSFYDEDGKLVKSRWIQRVKYLDDQGL